MTNSPLTFSDCFTSDIKSTSIYNQDQMYICYLERLDDIAVNGIKMFSHHFIYYIFFKRCYMNQHYYTMDVCMLMQIKYKTALIVGMLVCIVCMSVQTYTISFYYCQSLRILFCSIHVFIPYSKRTVPECAKHFLVSKLLVFIKMITTAQHKV